MLMVKRMYNGVKRLVLRKSYPSSERGGRTSWAPFGSEAGGGGGRGNEC